MIFDVEAAKEIVEGTGAPLRNASPEELSNDLIRVSEHYMLREILSQDVPTAKQYKDMLQKTPKGVY